MTRREFMREVGVTSMAAAATLSGNLIAPAWPEQPQASGAGLYAERIEIKPYIWQGPYAEMRDSKGLRHDDRLCAQARAPWMLGEDRLILRTSEIIGYDTGYFYDDHFPPSDPEGRGKNYRHSPFAWNAQHNGGGLSANCVVPGKGRLWLRLEPQVDFIDLELGVQDELSEPLGSVDWNFCVVGFESPSIGDRELERTFLFDGERLRSLREMSGAAKCELYRVAGPRTFIKAYRNYRPGPLVAKASVVIVEAVDRRHAAALGFQQSFGIYSNPDNKCFHADPYFGPWSRRGEQREMRGRLYLLEGTAHDAFERYRRDFDLRDSVGTST